MYYLSHTSTPYSHKFIECKTDIAYIGHVGCRTRGTVWHTPRGVENVLQNIKMFVYTIHSCECGKRNISMRVAVIYTSCAPLRATYLFEWGRKHIIVPPCQLHVSHLQTPIHKEIHYDSQYVTSVKKKIWYTYTDTPGMSPLLPLSWKDAY